MIQKNLENAKNDAEKAGDEEIRRQTNLDNQDLKKFSIRRKEFLPYELKSTKLIGNKKKMANYEDADYCFLTSKKTIALLLMELRPMFERGGVYYKIYNKIDSEEDFNKDLKDVTK